MKCLLILLFIYIANAKVSRIPSDKTKRYKADWSELDSRPLPEWYDRAKIGIFVHWGVYSVPSIQSEWLWHHWEDPDIIEFMRKNYPEGFTYQEFAPMLTAEFFDPSKWAKLFDKAGAKYVVLTSKHHEGYALYPSKHSFSWNSVEMGPKKDLVKELSEAVRSRGMKFGVYHSLYEWYNPIYLEDKKSGFATNEFVVTKLWPDIKQLITDYKPSIFWSDGDWETYDAYWNSTELLAWIYNDSPVKDEIVVNDRWGIGTAGKHGDFWNKDDRFNPGYLMPHKWENAFTIDAFSWGYRRNMEMNEVLSINQILYQVVSTISCGGNALINVGPTKEGTIPLIFQERLLSLGEWLDINGEAIYSSSPWLHQNDTLDGDVWYTCTKTQYNSAHPIATPNDSDGVTAIYAITLKWPDNNILKVKDIAPHLYRRTYTVELLGNNSTLNYEINDNIANIKFPDKSRVKSEDAWTLKFTQK